MLVLIKVQILPAHLFVAQHPIGGRELGHNQPAAAQVLDEPPKHRVRDASHGSQHRCRTNLNSPNPQTLWEGLSPSLCGADTSARDARTVKRLGSGLRLVPVLLHRPHSSLPAKSKAPATGEGSMVPEKCKSGANLLLRRLCLRGLGLGRFGFGGIALGVLPAEALDAAGRVHELLLTGKEWMAGGTNFYADVALMGGTGNKCVAAGTMHPNFVIVGMD